MAKSNSILTYIGIAGGLVTLLGVVGGSVVFYVNYAVDEAFDEAKPASVTAVETDIKLIRQDIGHIVSDVSDNKKIAQDTNDIFREYLEDQTQ